MQNKLLIIGIVTFLSIVPRLFYLNIPFERDEGTYAYISDTIDRGGTPYSDAFDHKPPAVYFLYNLSFKLFGHAISSPRLLVLPFIICACLLSFLFVYKISSFFWPGILTIILLGFSSSSPVYAGFASNTEVFTLPFIIGGALLLLDDKLSKLGYFFSGLLFGIALMIKQSVVTILLAAIICNIFRHNKHPQKNIPAFLFFALGSLFPLIMFAIYFAAEGSANAFWFGILGYNLAYITGPGINARLIMFISSMYRIIGFDAVTWVAGTYGIIIFTFSKGYKYQKLFFVSLVLGAIASVAMGGRFFPHYYVFLLPFLSIGAGLGVAMLQNKGMKLFAWVFSVLTIILSAGINTVYGRIPSKDVLLLAYSRATPFGQSVKIGNWLREHTNKNSTAFIIGSEPQILFYAGLKSPTRYFYFYPLMELTKCKDILREEVIHEMQLNMPEYLIVINYPDQPITLINNDNFIRRFILQFSQYELVAYNTYQHDEVISVDNLPIKGGRSLTSIPFSIAVYRRTKDQNGSCMNCIDSLLVKKISER